MKGLLYKSWLNVKPVATYYIIFVAVFFLVSLLNGDPLYFAAICVMIGVAVPLASMTSDDKDGWEKFAVAAGISRARFALGRYLFALFCQLPGWLLSGLLVLLCEDKLAALATVLFYCGAGLFAAALLLPLVFRLGKVVEVLVHVVRRVPLLHERVQQFIAFRRACLQVCLPRRREPARERPFIVHLSFLSGARAPATFCSGLYYSTTFAFCKAGKEKGPALTRPFTIF